MGELISPFLNKNGTIISSNLDKFVEPEIYDDYVFDNLADRQKKLIELGDAYLILPGGYGTHFEMLEAMTNNDVGMANKPIYVFNCNNIFDNMLNQITKLNQDGFITRDLNKINTHIYSNIEELANLINELLI